MQSVTTGQGSSITTGAAAPSTTGASQSITTGIQCETGPTVPDTISAPSGELNIRGGCMDLVFSVRLILSN